MNLMASEALEAMPGVTLAREVDELPAVSARAVTIGNFDGVHRGHRAVIQALGDLGLPRAVVTFDPHPREVFGSTVPALSSFQRRLELLAGAGVDEVLALPFTTDMARLPPEVWVDRYLRPIGTETVVVGADFRFGHRRAGDVELLRSLGFAIRSVPIIEGASSSEVRSLVQRGQLDLAAEILGRPHEIDVTVTGASAHRAGRLLELTPVARTPSVPPPGSYSAEVVSRRGGEACTSWVTVSDTGAVRVVARVRRPAGRIGERMRLLLPTPSVELMTHQQSSEGVISNGERQEVAALHGQARGGARNR